MPDSHEISSSTPAAAAPTSLWAAIRESLRGSHRDYTTGPIGRAILMLAIPMVLEMLMESTFAVVDIFWVLHIRPNAVAADAATTVGLTESMLTLMYAVAIGLGIGAAATVARRIGEKNTEGAARAAVQAIALGLIVSTVFAAIGVPLSGKLLGLMGGSPSVIQNVAFTRMMFAGNATIVMLFLINSIFRGAGDAAIAMRVLWLANSINIVLNPLLIFGIGPFPKLGIVGAAIGTNIGRGVGVIYALSRLVRRGGRFDVTRAYLRLEPQIMSRLLRLSSAATFQVFIGMASWIGLVRTVSSFGSNAVAGYTIGIRVIIFALMPSWGMSNAAATMVGQALGARNPARAESAVWRAGFYNMCCLGIVGLIFVVFARPIVHIFTADANVVPYGVDCLRIVAYGFLFYAYGMVLTQSFNGAGDTRTPTIINLFVFWMWELPLAYILAIKLHLGPRGVFLAIMIAFSTLAVVSAVVFRRGRWKTRVV